jgi:hypothetical protein
MLVKKSAQAPVKREFDTPEFDNDPLASSKWPVVARHSATKDWTVRAGAFWLWLWDPWAWNWFICMSMPAMCPYG